MSRTGKFCFLIEASVDVCRMWSYIEGYIAQFTAKLNEDARISIVAYGDLNGGSVNGATSWEVMGWKEPREFWNLWPILKRDIAPFLSHITPSPFALPEALCTVNGLFKQLMQDDENSGQYLISFIGGNIWTGECSDCGYIHDLFHHIATLVKDDIQMSWISQKPPPSMKRIWDHSNPISTHTAATQSVIDIDVKFFCGHRLPWKVTVPLPPSLAQNSTSSQESGLYMGANNYTSNTGAVTGAGSGVSGPSSQHSAISVSNTAPHQPRPSQPQYPTQATGNAQPSQNNGFSSHHIAKQSASIMQTTATTSYAPAAPAKTPQAMASANLGMKQTGGTAMNGGYRSTEGTTTTATTAYHPQQIAPVSALHNHHNPSHHLHPGVSQANAGVSASMPTGTAPGGPLKANHPIAMTKAAPMPGVAPTPSRDLHNQHHSQQHMSSQPQQATQVHALHQNSSAHHHAPQHAAHHTPHPVGPPGSATNPHMIQHTPMPGAKPVAPPPPSQTSANANTTGPAARKTNGLGPIVLQTGNPSARHGSQYTPSTSVGTNQKLDSYGQPQRTTANPTTVVRLVTSSSSSASSSSQPPNAHTTQTQYQPPINTNTTSTAPVAPRSTQIRLVTKRPAS
jgi:hypothetical protein